MLEQENKIQFYPKIARLLGNAQEALFLCLFIKDGDVEVCMTREEIENLTGLTNEQQRTAIKKPAAKGYVKITKKGLPATNHYQWDWDKLINDLRKYGDNK